MNFWMTPLMACCFAMGGWVCPASPEAAAGCDQVRYAPYRSEVRQSLIVEGSANKGPDSLAVNLLPVRGNWQRLSPNPRRYVDFTVTPHIEGDWRKCFVEFSTPNEGCGLIATTNRVSTAPEAGYSPCVRVSPDVFASDTFTLYVRTRNPILYVRIAPEKGAHDWTVAEGRVHFQFVLDSVDVNLTGSRALDPDPNLAELGVVGPNDLYRYFKDRRLLADLDLPKRIVARKAFLALQDEEFRLKRERTVVDRNIRELAGWSHRTGRNCPERAKFEDRAQTIVARLKEIADEMNKLDL